MEYIHELDEEITENIKQMLISPDVENINLALGILNCINISDEKTKEHVTKLMLDTECGLCIGFQHDDEYHMVASPEDINVLNKQKFFFYSANYYLYQNIKHYNFNK